MPATTMQMGMTLVFGLKGRLLEAAADLVLAQVPGGVCRVAGVRCRPRVACVVCWV